MWHLKSVILHGDDDFNLECFDDDGWVDEEWVFDTLEVDLTIMKKEKKAHKKILHFFDFVVHISLKSDLLMKSRSSKFLR